VIITTDAERAALVRANKATTRLLRELEAIARPGMTTRDLDAYARRYIADLGGEPVFETQAGFPGAINTNPNDIVVHGIPGDYVLRKGDIITIDAGILLGGYAGDAATTFTIGAPNRHQKKLIQTTLEAMYIAIAAAKTGNRVGDVSWAMQHHAETHGCTVALGFGGHGLGTHMWEDPHVPFAGTPGTGEELVEGMVLTVEPVVIEGKQDYYMANRWEARTKDRSNVAQFERAVEVRADGGFILSGD
jgi:methionyl aminopeptidase